MDRNPLWIGEVDIVRAIFGHAAFAEPDRLRRITSAGISGRVVEVKLEERIGRRRLDVLVTFADDSDGPDRYLIIEAKVGAIVDHKTLTDYLKNVRSGYGPVEGLLLAAYQPVGQLPPGWVYRDLGEVVDELSCSTSPVSECPLCEEIGYATAVSGASDAVSEWRALAQATGAVDLPRGWEMKGGGSSVGRPLVWFESPWLDGATMDSYVQVEVGNNYGKAMASVMIVALALTSAEKAPYPDRLWQVIAAISDRMPPLRKGVTDASERGRGAKGQAGVDATRNGVSPAWSRGFNQLGWHGRGRTLRQVDDDYAVLLPAAVEQGLALFEAGKNALRREDVGSN